MNIDRRKKYETLFCATAFDTSSSHIDVEGFPVCSLDDIIARKAAANRQRDRESLPRLRAFREYWLKNWKP